MLPRTRNDSGFSLIESLIAASLMLLVMASVFELVNPAHGAFRAGPETADVEQRLRVAADALTRELQMAGAGPERGERTGPLIDVFAPVLPFRQGRRNADPPATFRTDTITVLYGSPRGAQTTLAQPLAARSSVVQINTDPGCPAGDAACGFKVGSTAAVFDGTASYDLFTVTAVVGTSLTLQHNLQDSAKTYEPGISKIAEVDVRTLYARADAASDAFCLMQYNGANGGDVPVVDHTVGLSFRYFGDPEPPQMLKPLTDPLGPWTTYGPAPPPFDQQTTEYPPGENCLFLSNGSAMPLPRLGVLSSDGRGLVELPSSGLTDGPWCPDAASPNRFDADLFRIRSVVVKIRVEAAVAALRGPAGPLFSRGGTSAGGHGFVPDREVRFEITPRNLNLTR